MIVQSTFELRFGAVDRFDAAMARVVPAMIAQGWKPVGAFRNVTGDVSQVTHLWDLPDLESLSTAAGRAIAADSTLMAEVTVLGEVVVREQHVLMAPMSYDERATAPDGDKS